MFNKLIIFLIKEKINSSEEKTLCNEKNTLNVLNLAYKINQNELGVKYLETCLSITTRIILNFSYNDVYIKSDFERNKANN